MCKPYVKLEEDPFKERIEAALYIIQAVSDLFEDIDNDKENNQCVPIKLFYYMAVCRPSVFSNLDAIKKEINNFNLVGKLVDPNNLSDVVKEISFIITNKDYYLASCANAKNLSKNQYNWDKIENNFNLI